jgi:perosamine synthetase
MRIPLSSPDIDELDIAAVVNVLRTSQLSLGPVLQEFEQHFAGYLSVSNAVAVSSGTAGLHLCLLALGIGAGDEVIVPSFTFIAAANCVRYVGAVPVFVDIDATTLNLDPACVEAAITPRTRALMIVHNFGVPADLTELMALAGRFGLRVVEDACEAIGAEYHGRKVGTFGDAGVFAFYPNKQITTGEGGMVVTRDSATAATIRSLRNQGRSPGSDWLEHAQLGYNFRISEINCALGLAQLKRVDAILTMRRSVAAVYDEHLRYNPHLILPSLVYSDRFPSWFVYVVRLSAIFSREQRDAIAASLNSQGIGCGRYFAPVHLQPGYAPAAITLPVTEAEASRTLALPFFNRITPGEIREVCDNLLAVIASTMG